LLCGAVVSDCAYKTAFLCVTVKKMQGPCLSVARLFLSLASRPWQGTERGRPGTPRARITVFQQILIELLSKGIVNITSIVCSPWFSSFHFIYSFICFFNNYMLRADGDIKVTQVWLLSLGLFLCWPISYVDPSEGLRAQNLGWVCWFTPVIPATWEVKIQRTVVQGWGLVCGLGIGLLVKPNLNKQAGQVTCNTSYEGGCRLGGLESAASPGPKWEILSEK
jgi:hypothetical protein